MSPRPGDIEPLEHEKSENDPVLARLGEADLGYGHMRKRIDRINELQREGKGPGAFHDRLMRSLGVVREQRWPALDFAWNETPSPAWQAALDAEERARQAPSPKKGKGK